MTLISPDVAVEVCEGNPADPDWYTCESPVTHRKYGSYCERHHRQHKEREQANTARCQATGCRVTLSKGGVRTRNRRRYCRLHEGLLLDQMHSSTLTGGLERIAREVTVDWETSCWMWGGATNGHSVKATEAGRYGAVQVGTDRKAHGGNGSPLDWYTHRFMYLWAFGGHRNDHQLDHLCNRTLCCNPLHVEPTTQKRNAEAKGWRASIPDPWAIIDQHHRIPGHVFQWALMHGMPLIPAHLDLFEA